VNDRSLNNHPKILALLPGFIPSTLMDVVAPLLKLEKSGYVNFNITLEFYAQPRTFKNKDLIIFCRNTDPRYKRLWDYVVEQHIPYIYDLDDDFYAMSQDNPLGSYHSMPTNLNMLTQYLQHAALVRVYSISLLERLARMGIAAELVTPPLNWDLIYPRKKTTLEGPVRIVYATSRKQDTLSDLFAEALHRLLRTHSGKVEIHFWGFCPETFQKIPGVVVHPFNSNYADYLRAFSSCEYDIGLAPMLDDEFHRGKTNAKYREYGACEIAGIYSRVPLYATCVQEGETGILVDNTPDDWYTALVRLVEDNYLCRQIGQAARNDNWRLHAPDRFEQVWMAQITQALSPKLEICRCYNQPLPEKTRSRVSWQNQRVVALIRRLKETSPMEWFQNLRLQVRNLVMMAQIRWRKHI